VLVQRARRRQAAKRGGEAARVDAELDQFTVPYQDEELLAIDSELDTLAKEEPVAAEIVRLKIFAGLTTELAADALEISRATAYREWDYARAWLRSRYEYQAT
jgi:RNA polymerase sigma factor (TIGR02999 family)